MRKKNKSKVKIFFAMMLAGMLISIVSCVVLIKDIAFQNSEHDTEAIAAIVRSAISDELMQPIRIADSMSRERKVSSLLKECHAKGPKAIEAEMADHLGYILKEYGCNMVYLVCDSSKAYYTYDGIIKFVDVEHDINDKWYGDFVQRGKPIELNVDTDVDNDWELSVFVNKEIRDEANNFLGVCGIGVKMSRLQSLIAGLEEAKNIRVRLTDKNGLVQVSSDDAEIENAHVDAVRFDELLEGNIYYEKNDDVTVAAMKLNDVDWYIAIEDRNHSSMDALTIVTPSLIIFILSIFLMFRTFKLSDEEAKEKGKKDGLGSLGDIYISMNMIDLKKEEIIMMIEHKSLKRILESEVGFYDVPQRIFSVMCVPKHQEAIFEFTNLHTIGQRMRGKRTVYRDFISPRNGWCRARFIVDGDDLENINRLIFAVEDINEFKKEEEKVLRESIIDDLTHCYNRKAFENDFADRSNMPSSPYCVCVSVDINGLKPVNDELGHAAGDELISGAGKCLRNTLGGYGKVYRTGGDEFIATIYADDTQLQNIKSMLDYTVAEWEGEQVKSLHISAGYVAAREFPDYNIEQLMSVADKRMYNEKARYYQNKGMDRRSMQVAYNAICNSYVKILKVDLTADSFVVIKTDGDDLAESAGYSLNISEWFTGFANSGLIHPDDVEKFLRQTDTQELRRVFASGADCYVVSYRRIKAGRYIPVMLEMIAASTYTHERQEIFLYVKELPH